MTNQHRRQKLLDLVTEHGDVSVGQLAHWLASSTATVRRDLHWLAERNLLARAHGRALRLGQHGAIAATAGAGAAAAAAAAGRALRSACSAAGQKRAIARHASTLCENGANVIINGGSTTFMMAEFLADKKLTTLTNSFRLARRLLETTDIDVVLTAGTVDRRLDLILSPFTSASDVAPRHHASRTFLGVAAIAQCGLMEVEPAVVQAQSRLLGLSDELIVLADSSKFTRKASLIFCALNRIGSVITDSGAPDCAVQMLEQAGVKVIVVEPERDFSSLH